MQIKIHANIVTPYQTYEGEILFDKKIISLKKISESINPKLNFILPGFIDLHVHGGGGEDIMDTVDPHILLNTHLKSGTTSLLLTTVTSSEVELEKTFLNIKSKIKSQLQDEAKILGIHLEGPYINKEKLGAQPPFTRQFSLDEIKKLHQISPIKTITLAPELINIKIIQELKKMNILVQIGHSNGEYQDGVDALQNGAITFTHLYNAMSGLHHRKPGIVGAALAYAEYSELIPDLIHVHPGAIKVALRSIPKLYFVTDATSATGMPDGQYRLGENEVTKCHHGVRLKDGTLAGSSLSMLEALKNLVSHEIGLTISEASYRLSTIQSELLGIKDERGEIRVGLFADIIELNHNMNIEKIFCEGVLV